MLGALAVTLRTISGVTRLAFNDLNPDKNRFHPALRQDRFDIEAPHIRVHPCSFFAQGYLA